MNNDFGVMVFFGLYAIFWLLLLLLFVLPSFLAFYRGHPNRWLILAVNIFLGGTGIGWAVALIWALVIHLTKQPNGSNGGESGLNVFANDVRRVRLEPSMEKSPAHLPRPPLSTSDALEQIDRLGRLRDAGHLTEAEFVSLKDDILRSSLIKKGHAPVKG